MYQIGFDKSLGWLVQECNLLIPVRWEVVSLNLIWVSGLC
jgi:hypothetical protein